MARRLPHRRRPAVALLMAPILAAAWAVAAIPATADEAFELQLPIRCTPGADCWPVNLVDLDPGPGVRDYACGASTYDGHKGTDIAIRDMKALARGVDVVAAAPGIVRGTRDGMEDVDVTVIGKQAIKGRECGNGVVIAHGGDWETQYCHMRKGSVAVTRGDRVAAGDKLGLVGHSGDAQFPHLHLSVRLGKRVVDPFAGLDRKEGACGAGPHPLWRQGALKALAVDTTVIFNIGFHDGKPDPKDARAGELKRETLAADAGVLALWADMYWPHAGDAMRFRIVAPDGRPLVDRTVAIDKTQARRFAFVGKRRRTDSWPAGTYTGEVTLTRGQGTATGRVFRATAQATVR